MKKLSRSLSDRFWEKVDASLGPDGCWPWMASKNPDGYGWIRRCADGLMALAHRVCWELVFGEILSGLSVLHSCDNPPCCNPRHLFLGDQIDNMADMTAKGRRAGRPTSMRGEAVASAKLTSEKVIEIRRLYAEGGISQSELAEMFGVTQTPISSLIAKKTWAHI